MTRRAIWTTVAILVVTAWVGSAQQRRPSLSPVANDARFFFRTKPARLPQNRDPERLAQLQRNHQPLGDWGGAGCPSVQQMRGLVDDYLATPHPAFPGLGPTIPGVSTSWSSRDCGQFTYAAGIRSVEDDKPITPATLMGIASMTKPIMAAITLILNDSGLFGPQGLDATVDQLLTPAQITALTTGEDPGDPRCPGAALLFNRQTEQFELTAFSCPDLSQVTLRQLMTANHGMYDFVNEVGSATFFTPYFEGLYFEALRFLGLPAIQPPNSNSAYEVLKAYGLKRNTSAVIGGNLVRRDFETSLGNTGFQLLGIILEHRTGRSLDDLIRTFIVAPLGTDDIFVHVDSARHRNQISNGYDVETGEPLIEATGVYPLVSLNGHTAVNTRELGLGVLGNFNLAGGAGSLVANMQSYRVFLDAFVNGGLLGDRAQSEFNSSFVFLPDVSDPVIFVQNGLGLVKEVVRGLPGFPDLDLYRHNGRLPGVGCENAVIDLADPGLAPLTGALCINSSGLAFPSSSTLLFEFFDLFNAARRP